MINVRVTGAGDLATRPEIVDAVRAAETELGDRGRVLLRPSGTEPVVRVMVEGVDAGQVERLCAALAATVEGALAAA
jgi:phosphoglucosamine mutase